MLCVGPVAPAENDDLQEALPVTMSVVVGLVLPLGFLPQCFLDSWGPVHFFAMIFAISMNYTVFLLSSAKEHYGVSGDAKDAVVNAVAHSGQLVFSAARGLVSFACSAEHPKTTSAQDAPYAAISISDDSNDSISYTSFRRFLERHQPPRVMIAVSFTFALSGPLSPKEMGTIPGEAVFLDAFLVRLILTPVLLRLRQRRRVAADVAGSGVVRHQFRARLIESRVANPPGY